MASEIKAGVFTPLGSSSDLAQLDAGKGPSQAGITVNASSGNSFAAMNSNFNDGDTESSASTQYDAINQTITTTLSGFDWAGSTYDKVTTRVNDLDGFEDKVQDNLTGFNSIKKQDAVSDSTTIVKGDELVEFVLDPEPSNPGSFIKTSDSGTDPYYSHLLQFKDFTELRSEKDNGIETNTSYLEVNAEGVVSSSFVGDDVYTMYQTANGVALESKNSSTGNLASFELDHNGTGNGNVWKTTNGVSTARVSIAPDATISSVQDGTSTTAVTQNAGDYNVNATTSPDVRGSLAVTGTAAVIQWADDNTANLSYVNSEFTGVELGTSSNGVTTELRCDLANGTMVSKVVSGDYQSAISIDPTNSDLGNTFQSILDNGMDPSKTTNVVFNPENFYVAVIEDGVSNITVDHTATSITSEVITGLASSTIIQSASNVTSTAETIYQYAGATSFELSNAETILQSPVINLDGRVKGVISVIPTNNVSYSIPVVNNKMYIIYTGITGTMTLPIIANNTAVEIYIIHKGTGTLTIQSNNGVSADIWDAGVTSATTSIIAGQVLHIINDGTNWSVIS